MSAVPRRRLKWWEALGIVVASLVLLAGLAVLALAVLFVVAMSQYGSNK